jgi:hypothetical protein
VYEARKIPTIAGIQNAIEDVRIVLNVKEDSLISADKGFCLLRRRMYRKPSPKLEPILSKVAIHSTMYSPHTSKIKGLSIVAENIDSSAFANTTYKYRGSYK